MEAAEVFRLSAIVAGAEEADGESAASWRASARPSAGLAVRREEGRLFMLEKSKAKMRGPESDRTARRGRLETGEQPERTGDQKLVAGERGRVHERAVGA